MSQPLASLFLRTVQDRLEHSASEDMGALARLYLRSRRLPQEIAEWREASERWRQHWAEALMGSLYLQQISAVLAWWSSQRKQSMPPAVSAMIACCGSLIGRLAREWPEEP